VRRAGVLAAAIVVALAGSIGLIAFLQSRDDADIGGARTTAGPGEAAASETEARLRKGNVVLTYSDQRDGPALRALAEDVAGPPDMSLVDAGQAVVVEQRPDQDEPVVARAYRRRLVADSGASPEVREFVEFWLGQPAVE
jgi:Protein of unknown function (DUF3105)